MSYKETLSKRAWAARPRNAALWIHAGICGLAWAIILLFTRPAFSGFFIGEDFIYYGFWQNAKGNILRASLTPLNSIFFRPASVFWNILFQTVLPPDPFAHHLRNYVMTCVLTLALWVLICRVTSDWFSRVAAIGLFVISKVHLTDIGYINCDDSVLSALHLVLLIYFLIVYLQTGGRWGLWLSWVFFAMETGSRDYGIASLAPVLIIIAVDIARKPLWDWSRFARTALPYIVIILGYLVVRWYAVGKFHNAAGTVYELRFSVIPFVYRAYLFAGNLLNLSLGAVETTGMGNFSDVAAQFVPVIGGHRQLLNLAFLALGSLFLLAILTVGVLRDKRIWAPVAWVGVYMIPTFLIQNIQIYYMLEALAGLALAVGMAFATLGRYRRVTFAIFVLLLCVSSINAAIQARNVRMFSWRFCADGTERAYRATILPYVGKAVDQWALLVGDPVQRDFWSFNMTSNSMSPLVSVLLRRPELRARVMPPEPASIATIPNFGRAIVYIVENGQFVHVVPPAIDRVMISGATPDGGHVVKVLGANFQSPVTVLFDGSPVPSKVLEKSSLTVTVPKGPASGFIVVEQMPLGVKSPAIEVEFGGPNVFRTLQAIPAMRSR